MWICGAGVVHGCLLYAGVGGMAWHSFALAPSLAEMEDLRAAAVFSVDHLLPLRHPLQRPQPQETAKVSLAHGYSVPLMTGSLILSSLASWPAGQLL